MRRLPLAFGTLAFLAGSGLLAGAPLPAGTDRMVTPTPSISMTCAEAVALINTRGSAVLATSRTLYDRYVRDRSFCLYDQDTKPEWVPTKDNPQCFIGYSCFEPFRGGSYSR